MQTQDREPDHGDEPELITPEDFLPRNPYPPDAQRLGFDRYTGGDGGILAVAASLDSRKPAHRLIAAVLLALVVGSFVLTLWGQLT